MLIYNSKLSATEAGEACVFLVMLDLEAPPKGGVGALLFLLISGSGKFRVWKVIRRPVDALSHS